MIRVEPIDGRNWRAAVAAFGNDALSLMARAYVFGEPAPQLVYDGDEVVGVAAGEITHSIEAYDEAIAARRAFRTESGRSSSEEAALTRLASAAARRTVRLAADFGRDWPLWEDDSVGDRVNLCTAPGDYGISDGLTAEIHDWFEFWLMHYDPNTMWDSPVNNWSWIQRGKVVRSRLQRELKNIADVVFTY